MIPQVRNWVVTDTITGKVYVIPTITKKLVKIIMGMDHVESWGHKLKIVSSRQFKL